MSDKEHPVPYQRQMVDIGDIYVGADGGHEIWRTPKAIPDISQKMLTVTLRTLEQDGIVNRRAYAQIPPKVEYSLTSRGQSLLPRLNALIDWAKEQMDAIMEDRARSGQKASATYPPERQDE